MKNKVAIITGAAGGVGKETVKLFVENGAKVVAVDLNPKVNELTLAFGDAVSVIIGDVTKADVVDEATELALSRWSSIDILINNVGYTVPKTILDLEEEEWDKVMNVNVKSMFLFCKKVIPVMQRQGKGAIVTTASISGIVGLKAQSVYCASKGAIILLTKQLAIEYAKENIRVNAVGPGAIDTPFLTEYFDSQPDPEKTAQDVAAAHPMGRWATPVEVAKALYFLASEDASFITGAVLMVDGGYTAA